MSAQSIQPAFTTFQDIDGQPLEGGNIYIGTAGLAAATNQITVYWDSALTQAVTQPIRTTGGYPMNNNAPGVIYTGADDFSIAVNDKNNSTIYSALNKTESLSSDFITYLQPLTGAVSRTLTSKINEVVSVTDFGAVGDGVTDDTLAIRAAITACFPDTATYSVGGVDYHVATHELYVPQGRYRVTGTVFAGQTFSSIKKGAGFSMFGPNIKPQYAGGNTALETSPSVFVADVGAFIENQSVVDMQNCVDSSICNIAIKGEYTVTKGLDISNGSGWRTNNVAVYQHKYGLYINSSGLGNHSYGGVSNCSHNGIYLRGSGDCDFAGMYINTNNQDTIVANQGIGFYAAVSGNLNIRGGKIEYNAIGLYLNDTQGTNVSGINFDLNSQCNILANYTSAAGTAPNALQLKSITITGNRFLSGGTVAGGQPLSHINIFSASADSHFVITGNSFRRGSAGAWDDASGTGTVGPVTYCIYAEHSGTSAYTHTYAVSGNDFYNGSATNTIGAIGTNGANINFVGSNIINLPHFITGVNTRVNLEQENKGFWTPSLSFGGASVGLTYYDAQGSYSKIGDQVTIMGRIYINAVGSSTGAAVISGLPFTPAGDAAFGTSPLYPVALYTSQWAGPLPQARIDGSEATIELFDNVAGVAVASDHANFAGFTSLSFSATYRV